MLTITTAHVYDRNDKNGEKISHWIDVEGIFLIRDVKESIKENL